MFSSSQFNIIPGFEMTTFMVKAMFDRVSLPNKLEVVSSYHNHTDTYEQVCMYNSHTLLRHTYYIMYVYLYNYISGNQVTPMFVVLPRRMEAQQTKIEVLRVLKHLVTTASPQAIASAKARFLKDTDVQELSNRCSNLGKLRGRCLGCARENRLGCAREKQLSCARG